MPSLPRRPRDPWLLAIIGLALYGTVSALAATTAGVGVSPDSVVYLAAAGSARDGHGLVVPAWDGRPAALTHYPPLFPLALAGLGRTGVDLLAAARAINALLFAVTILLVAFAINRFSRPLTRAAFLGAAVVATSLDLLSAHSMAWSEPLFIALGLGGLCLLGAQPERARAGTLVSAALAVALASLTRFPGVALVLGGTAAISFTRAWPPRLRWRRALCFSTVAASPLALWMLGNVHATGNAADRPLAMHSVAAWQMKSGLLTVSSWVLPGAACCLGKPAIVVLGGGAIVACLAALTIAGRRAPADGAGHAPTTTRIGALFALSYLAVLGLDMTLLDASQWPNDRIMTPVFVAIVVVAFDRIRRLDTSPGPWQATGRRTMAAVCLLLLAIGVVAQARFVIDAHAYGVGFTHLSWRRSPAIARTRDLPADAPIYSNRPDAIRFLAGRPASGVPLKRDFRTLRTNPVYSAELAALGDRLLAGRAYLVWFPTDVWSEEYVPSRAELENGLGLRALHREADGTIYGVPRQ